MKSNHINTVLNKCLRFGKAVKLVMLLEGLAYAVNSTLPPRNALLTT